MAPGTTSATPWSPPMASTASRIPRWPAPSLTLLSLGCVFLRGLDLQHRPAAVIAAVRAGPMAALRLVAVRAILELGKRQRVMRAPVALSSVGDPALGHAHGECCSFRCATAGWRPVPRVR